jgi:thiosulfate/3-mercaptopyruvate sulfurtransferase
VGYWSSVKMLRSTAPVAIKPRGSPTLIALIRTGVRRQFSSYLITPAQLAKEFPKDKSIIPLCASWFMPNDPQKRTGQSVFSEKRLPRARLFDLDAVIDKDSPYPHMLPSPEEFATAMGKLGVRPSDRLVIYDSSELGLFSAPRVGWTFKIFGHENVHVLNNFKLWVAEGYEVESGNPSTWEATSYPIPDLDQHKVIAFEDLKALLEKQKESGVVDVQILDARSYGRWAGTDKEPRPGLFLPLLNALIWQVYHLVICLTR